MAGLRRAAAHGPKLLIHDGFQCRYQGRSTCEPQVSSLPEKCEYAVNAARGVGEQFVLLAGEPGSGSVRMRQTGVSKGCMVCLQCSAIPSDQTASADRTSRRSCCTGGKCWK